MPLCKHVLSATWTQEGLPARGVVGVAQMSGWAGAQSLHAEGGRAIAYTGMCDCFMRTVRDEGVKALFKVSRAAPPRVLSHMLR